MRNNSNDYTKMICLAALATALGRKMNAPYGLGPIITMFALVLNGYAIKDYAKDKTPDFCPAIRTNDFLYSFWVPLFLVRELKPKGVLPLLYTVFSGPAGAIFSDWVCKYIHSKTALEQPETPQKSSEALATRS